MTEKFSRDRLDFENAIRALEAQAANLGTHVTIDASTRVAYSREIKIMADELRRQAETGKISWAAAARQAQDTRNIVMEICRRRSTPVGRSFSQKIKMTGRSLNELIATNTRRMYGDGAVFSTLSPVQRNRVYATSLYTTRQHAHLA